MTIMTEDSSRIKQDPSKASFPVRTRIISKVMAADFLVKTCGGGHSTRSRARNYASITAERDRLRVLLDMDMVLCDFEGHFLTLFRARHPDEPFILPEKRHGFYMRDQYEKMKPGLGEFGKEIQEGPGFFLNMPVIAGAIEAVEEMSQMDGVDVFIVTSPMSNYSYCVKEKYEWVEKHMGRSWVDKLILTKDKTVVDGHLLIDDRPSIPGVIATPKWEHIVFTACHNERLKLHGKRRLNNWTDGTWRELIMDFKKRI